MQNNHERCVKKATKVLLKCVTRIQWIAKQPSKIIMMKPSWLVIVPGATHLFEEPGALEQVAKLATNWFTTHLNGGHE